MSKLLLDLKVPNDYKKSDLTDIIRAICQQVNTLSEGRISARYQAQASTPSSVPAAVGDVIWNSSPTVVGSVAPGVAAKYVNLGWVCVAGSGTAPTFVEMRVLTGS